MTDRTYSLKELYQYVVEYSEEANEEGFDSSVGDFVDWVASREDLAVKPGLPEKLDTDRENPVWKIEETINTLIDYLKEKKL